MLLHRRSRSTSGFTLIELLIVIAIIGIISAILIPNLLDSLQKAKQRRTMSDMMYMGKAMMAWWTDQVGGAAAGTNVREIDISMYSSEFSSSELTDLLAPRYLAEVPETDGWGTNYEYFINDDALDSVRILFIRSAGRDGAFTADSYSVSNYTTTDYDQDIVWADGFFIRWPQSEN